MYIYIHSIFHIQYIDDSGNNWSKTTDFILQNSFVSFIWFLCSGWNNGCRVVIVLEIIAPDTFLSEDPWKGWDSEEFFSCLSHSFHNLSCSEKWRCTGIHCLFLQVFVLPHLAGAIQPFGSVWWLYIPFYFMTASRFPMKSYDPPITSGTKTPQRPTSVMRHKVIPPPVGSWI